MIDHYKLFRAAFSVGAGLTLGVGFMLAVVKILARLTNFVGSLL